MTAREVRLDGIGLHGGRPCAVTFRARSGPTTLGVPGAHAPLSALAIARTDRATSVRIDRDHVVAGVEHALAAVSGLGAFAGLAIEVEGTELPLVDGAARAFAEAIDAVRAAESAPIARVTRPFSIDVDEASYVFEPDEGTHVEASIAFAEERFGIVLAGAAAWSGGREAFLAEIATARTFGAKRELDALRARGLAAHVPEGAVVVLDVDDARYRPSDPGEPIRHKLLDLLGDLALLGARFVGRLHASRPSHAATAEALRRARDAGVFV
jgi:UDP-3-O-[3-hydroxymyristoyl] N-acetylglucosamine deacetylase